MAKPKPAIRDRNLPLALAQARPEFASMSAWPDGIDNDMSLV